LLLAGSGLFKYWLVGKFRPHLIKFYQNSLLKTIHSRQAITIGAHVLLPLAVYSKSERKENSMPPLGFEPASFATLATLNSECVGWLIVLLVCRLFIIDTIGTCTATLERFYPGWMHRL
jgi:hypothetical protein